jgi:DNA helicase-2/ATP-dependent DNA helicase PcrA
MTNEDRLLGPPGTGKTTTASRMIAEAAKEYGSDRVLVASFTKAAAVELAGRNLPLDSSQVGTLHAICYRALDNPVIAETRMHEWNDEYPRLAMTASAGGNDDPSWDMSMRSEADRMMAAYQTLRARMLPIKSAGDHELLDFAERWEDWKRQTGYIDFTDMIELALRNFDAAPGDPSVMFIDEAQDMAPLDFALVRKWGEQMERLIVIGDDDQAIYAFKGADPQSLFSGEPRSSTVLEQSHRIPRAVHAAAARLTGQLSWRLPKVYRPRDAEGLVEGLTGADYGRPEAAVRRAKELVADGKSVMFLASCSYMLKRTCEALKEAGVAYHNPYKLKRQDWNPLAVGTAARRTALDRVIAYLAISPEARGRDAHIWDGDEFRLWASCIDAAKFFKRGVKTQITAKDFRLPPGDVERVTAIGNMLSAASADLGDAEHFSNAFEGDLAWLERNLKGDQGQRMRYPVRIAKENGPKALLETPRVITGTVHSVKGGEADVVFLYPDVSYAGKDEYSHVGSRRDSVLRLYYVALTRAREGVYICDNATQNFVPLLT